MTKMVARTLQRMNRLNKAQLLIISSKNTTAIPKKRNLKERSLVQEPKTLTTPRMQSQKRKSFQPSSRRVERLLQIRDQTENPGRKPLTTPKMQTQPKESFQPSFKRVEDLPQIMDMVKKEVSEIQETEKVDLR